MQRVSGRRVSFWAVAGLLVSLGAAWLGHQATEQALPWVLGLVGVCAWLALLALANGACWRR